MVQIQFDKKEGIKEKKVCNGIVIVLLQMASTEITFSVSSLDRVRIYNKLM